MNKNIFITGSTGFVGRKLLEDYLSQTNYTFLLLIRPTKQKTAEDRFEALLASLEKTIGPGDPSLRQRLHLVEGTLDEPRLGLHEKDFQDLARKTDRIMHGAASINLSPPLDQARDLHVGGIKTILELSQLAMQHGGLERLNYISTAYVAGKRTGLIYEDDLDQGQKFVNFYEQSKLESEKEVRKMMPHLPISVFRPSIIVGDSRTGWTRQFNVVYVPIRLIYMGKLSIVPASRKSKFDTIPIDFASKSILYLSQLDKEVIGKTFHITVGANREILVTDLVEKGYKNLCKYIDQYGIKNPKIYPKRIHPLIFQKLTQLAGFLGDPAKKRMYERFQALIPYTYYYKEFNNDQAMRLMQPAGITPPRMEEYMDAICKYCVETHFGTSNKPKDVIL